MIKLTDAVSRTAFAVAAAGTLWSTAALADPLALFDPLFRPNTAYDEAPRACHGRGQRQRCRPSGQSAPAGGVLSHDRSPRHDRYRYAAHLPLPRARRRQGHALRHWNRTRRLHVVGHADHPPQAGMAGLDPARRNDPAPAVSAALHG